MKKILSVTRACLSFRGIERGAAFHPRERESQGRAENGIIEDRVEYRDRTNSSIIHLGEVGLWKVQESEAELNWVYNELYIVWKFERVRKIRM